ncbi:MAG TPA: hypothetical protein VFJ91_01035 [Gaiellaceae bacterium]|nr:hypothetical protein [Gaiellaceae bacterium]
MRIRLGALLCLAAVAFVAAGCGGGGSGGGGGGGGDGGSSSDAYTASGTAPCLKQQGFTGVTTAADKVGFIAGFADHGGLKATSSDGNTVVIAFTKDESSVAGTKRAFTRQAGKPYRNHMRDIMQSQGNAVLVWATSPGQQTLDLALGCLKP